MKGSFLLKAFEIDLPGQGAVEQNKVAHELCMVHDRSGSPRTKAIEEMHPWIFCMLSDDWGPVSRARTDSATLTGDFFIELGSELGKVCQDCFFCAG